MRAIYILLIAIGISAIIVLSIKDRKMPVERIIPNYYRAYVYKTGDTVMVRDASGEEVRIGDTVTILKIPGDSIHNRQTTETVYRQDTGKFTVSHREAIIIK